MRASRGGRQTFREDEYPVVALMLWNAGTVRKIIRTDVVSDVGVAAGHLRER